MTSQLARGRNRRALPGGRGRGPGGQPAGFLLPAGRCPVPGCGSQIDATRLMCRRDWYRVPKRLRDRVWATWCSGRRAGSPEHQQAVLKAVTAARLARLPGWRRPLAQLRLLLPGHDHDPALQTAAKS